MALNNIKRDLILYLYKQNFETVSTFLSHTICVWSLF